VRLETIYDFTINTKSYGVVEARITVQGDVSKDVYGEDADGNRGASEVTCSNVSVVLVEAEFLDNSGNSVYKKIPLEELETPMFVERYSQEIFKEFAQGEV
jgi:hypothetical protein